MPTILFDSRSICFFSSLHSNKIVGMVKDAHVGASVEIAQADTNSSSGMQVFLETQPFSIGGITGANMKIKYYQINPKTKFKQSWTADVIATTAPSVDKVKENIPRRDMIMVSKYMEPLLEELAMKIKKMADETEAARKKLETP